jgi:hypothetical protein
MLAAAWPPTLIWGLPQDLTLVDWCQSCRRVPFVVTILDGYNTGVLSTTHVLGPGRSTTVTGETITLLTSISCTTQPPVTARPPATDVCSLPRIRGVFHLDQICYLGLLPPTGTQQVLRRDWGIFECFFTVRQAAA